MFPFRFFFNSHKRNPVFFLRILRQLTLANLLLFVFLMSSVDLSAWFALGAQGLTDLSDVNVSLPSSISTILSEPPQSGSEDETLALEIASLYTRLKGNRDPVVRNCLSILLPSSDAMEIANTLSQKASMTIVIALVLLKSSSERPNVLTKLKAVCQGIPAPSSSSSSSSVSSSSSGTTISSEIQSLLTPIASLGKFSETATPVSQFSNPSLTTMSPEAIVQALTGVQSAIALLSQQMSSQQAQLTALSTSVPGCGTAFATTKRDAWRRKEAAAQAFSNPTLRQQIFMEITAHSNALIESESLRLAIDSHLQMMSSLLEVMSTPQSNPVMTAEQIFTKQFRQTARFVEAVSYYIEHNRTVVENQRYGRAYPRLYYELMEDITDDFTPTVLSKVRSQAGRAAGKVPSFPKNASFSKNFSSRAPRGGSFRQKPRSSSPVPSKERSRSRSRSSSQESRSSKEKDS